MAITPTTHTAEDAYDDGVLGTTYDPIENEDYTITGQGAETAAAELAAGADLRAYWLTQSRAPVEEEEPPEEPEAAPAQAPKRKPSASSSSGSGEGS